MKKVFTLILCTLMAISANAQLSRSVSEELHTHVHEYEVSSYHRYEFGFKVRTLNFDGIKGYDADPITIAAFTAAWTVGHPLKVSTLPLYWETGARIAFGGGENNDDAFYRSSWLISAMAPLNIVYRHQLNDDLFIAPFAGLYMKLGAMIDEWEFKGSSDMDMDCKNPFELGMQLGANLDYKKFHIGISWQPAFTSRTIQGEHIDVVGHSSAFNISAGWVISK